MIKFLLQPLVLFSKWNSNDINYQITFRLVGELHKEDAEYSQVIKNSLVWCMTVSV